MDYSEGYLLEYYKLEIFFFKEISKLLFSKNK
jgi:hypothetical protein